MNQLKRIDNGFVRIKWMELSSYTDFCQKLNEQMKSEDCKTRPIAIRDRQWHFEHLFDVSVCFDGRSLFLQKSIFISPSFAPRHLPLAQTAVASNRGEKASKMWATPPPNVN